VTSATPHTESPCSPAALPTAPSRHALSPPGLPSDSGYSQPEPRPRAARSTASPRRRARAALAGTTSSASL